jgi:putative heme-binding domain-containing protein
MPNRRRCRLLVAYLVVPLLALPAAAQKNEDQPKNKEPTVQLDPRQAPVPDWIWAAKANENQTVGFRGTFELPQDLSNVASASLWLTCDNEVQALVNGRNGPKNTIWQVPVTGNIRKALQPGKNVVALLARNQNADAGLLAKLQVKFKDGKTVDLVTGGESFRYSEALPNDWHAVNFDDSKWSKPRVIGKYGIGPWDQLPRAGIAGIGGKATPAEDLTVLPGFKAELLYSVPKESEDSWVAMTADPRGRLIVSGQSGPLFRVTVGKTAEDTKVEKIDIPLGMAQGLLWAYDSLYVTVNGPGYGGNDFGLYRATDTNGDDKLDKVEKLFKVKGEGEHGPHAVRLGPGGKIYLVAGNFTPLPEGVSKTSPHKNWAEDLLLPRNPDGGGHDPHIMAPAGWVIRFEKDGKNRELLCAGLRNTYDIDFDPDGELFGYDSDMEWDTGTPWYRPIRVNLLVSGGEYGWRNGTGKWPEYYPDSLGAVVNTGMGSPTGVTFGTVAKFPAKYQRAFFISDWSYGNVYAVHMTPEGAGYRGTFEKFVYGKPFGVTDCIINPVDGNMYITIGGRGSQSGLYRISYVGNESTAPAKPAVDQLAADARALRHKIESFHGKPDPAAVDFVWQYLDSPDRYLRYAARVALEWQPVESWKQRALDERSPTASINALIALIRSGAISAGQRPDKTMAFKPNPELLQQVIASLGELSASSLTEEQTLEGLRALGLAFARLGPPDGACASAVTAALDGIYPSQSRFVNRELAQLLAYLQSPTVVSKSMKLFEQSDTQEDKLHYLLVLRGVKAGWTPELRQAYFARMNVASEKYTGGYSFKNFMTRIREDAITTLTPQEKEKLAAILNGGQKIDVAQDNVGPPRQFVRNWQMSDLLPVIDRAASSRDFEKGKAAYAAAQCAKCHRFNNDGGSTGPDLTGAGNRFAPADVLESIIQPSKVISDQYRPTEFITKSRTLISGQIEAEDAETVTIRANPLATETVKLKKSDIAKQRPARLSLMPEGLLDTLNQDEILDLIAYVRSGGHKNDRAFAK